MTLRWREMDSNHLYCGTKSCCAVRLPVELCTASDCVICSPMPAELAYPLLMLLVPDFGKIASDLELHTLLRRDLPWRAPVLLQCAEGEDGLLREGSGVARKRSNVRGAKKAT